MTPEREIDNKLYLLRFELVLLKEDKKGSFESYPERIRRRKIELVAKTIVLYTKFTEVFDEVNDARLSFKAGRQGSRLSSLRQNT